MDFYIHRMLVSFLLLKPGSAFVVYVVVLSEPSMGHEEYFDPFHRHPYQPFVACLTPGSSPIPRVGDGSADDLLGTIVLPLLHLLSGQLSRLC